ncbi:polyphosphate kinase 1 [Flavobacteriales bacterium]|nr:polyphosphate kinase 1 [Flavobacteriales bacterium]
MTKNPIHSDRLINRELSWLAFNHRVLQEAVRTDNPLIERVRFLGIFSNNMDEFFRVRVANLQRAMLVDESSTTTLGFGVQSTLQAVTNRVVELQGEYNQAYERVEQALEEEGIRILNEEQFSEEQEDFVANYFKQQIRPHLVPIMITEGRPFPDLKDGVLYFMVGLETQHGSKVTKEYALVQIPPHRPRFVILPSPQGNRSVAFVDDVIRKELHKIFQLFQPDRLYAHAIKVTRDAEIDMDDDLSMSLMDKMADGVSQRKNGDFVRMIYDREMPAAMLDLVMNKLDLGESENIISGTRYHNRKDLMKFPDFGRSDLVFPKRKAHKHKYFQGKSSMLNQVVKRDVLLHFPYHNFGQVVDALREAAIDPTVERICINLYRVAHNSKIINALVNAAYNGKKVQVVIELAARFDERHNIKISNVLQEAGIQVEFGVTGLKVHSKMFLIDREVEGKRQRIAYIGTGNFHEEMARVFSDFGLFTANADLTDEVAKLFSFFSNNYERPDFEKLVVSPYQTRSTFLELLDRETEHARQGRTARVILKLNNLVDAEMIEALYAASQSGVRIDLIVRGICSLIPGVKGMSENIKVRSLLGRYLEHARVLYFENNGSPTYFLSSADWMKRNLDHRVEVSVPIEDIQLQSVLAQYLDHQLKDNVHARKVDVHFSNAFIAPKKGGKTVDASELTHQVYAQPD